MRLRKFINSRMALAVALAGAMMSSTLAGHAAALAAEPVQQAVASTAAPALPKGVERVASVEGITEYHLSSNGMKVLLVPDQSKPTITVNITYLVGSRNENYGETGMAHLLEHLVFMGTPTYPNIKAEFAKRGGRYNGTTSFDRTNYFITVAATDDNLDWALKIEADRMVNSNIAKSELDSEMSVVRNEFESGENSPFLVMFKRMFATAYDWHNYSNLPIGARSDIENVPIDRLQAFYRNYYQPDNAVLLIAGKFDESKTIARINDIFGAIPRPARTLRPSYTVEPAQDGERMAVARRVGDTQVIAAGYKIPSSSHPDFATLDVLSEIVGADATGRLHKSIVETKKAASAGAILLQFRDPGLMMFFAEARKDQSLDDARTTLIQTVEEVAAKPPTAEEIERARTSLLKEIDLTLNSADRIGVGLSEWMATGDWRLFYLHRDRIRKVTAADVQRVAASYFKSQNRTIGMFIPTDKPERVEIPASPDVAALVKDYKGDAAVAAGEAFDSSPANIETRTMKIDAPTGLDLALLSKKTRGNTVVANMTIRYGNEKSLMGRSTIADFAGDMLMRGTTKHTRQQLKDEFDRLKARVGVSGGAGQANVSIETVRENLPAVMRLVAEVLREPSFPASEFEQLKQEQLAALEQQKSDPQTIAVNNFNRHLSPYPKGHVRYVPTLDEQVAEINAATLDDVKKFYKDFYGASTGQVSVVGDFDDKAMTALVRELFGDWKSPGTYERVPAVYNDVPALVKGFETPDKENAFFVAGVNLPVRDDDPDYPALVLGNYILGGSGLNSRLSQRIRSKEGISYGVGSQFSAGTLDKAGSFVAFAIYAPQNIGRLEAAFKEEIEKALKEGFSAEEVAAAKTGYLQSREVGRAQDAGLSRQLANYLFLNRTLQWDADFEKKIAALTPEQINAAMRRHLDASKLTVIKAGDFAKSSAAAK